MECNLWEEKGLLYLAGELAESEQQVFKGHLATCEYCQTELQLYQKEKETLFKPEMFEDEPSPAVDHEIIRVCSQPIKPAVHMPLFPAYVKNVIFALLILVVGFGGGAYFAGLKVASDIKTVEQATDEKDKLAIDKKDSHAASQMVVNQRRDDDSLSDSAESDSAHIFKRGNLNTQGVVPVDLTDE